MSVTTINNNCVFKFMWLKAFNDKQKIKVQYTIINIELFKNRLEAINTMSVCVRTININIK